MSVTVELVNVNYGYRAGGALSVCDASFTVDAGGISAILGPSGSGKSTLLALIAGLECPWSGDILFDGVSVTSVPANRRTATLVLQQPFLFPHLSVADNVGFGLAARGVSPPERERHVARWLARVGLDGLGARRPRQLSGGEQQRVALVRALAVRPQVLLLDEPFASLDAHVRDEMQSLVRAIVAEEGVTTILVTHDRSEAMALGSRMVLLDAGRIVAEGPAQALFEQPPSRSAARLLGVTTAIVGTVRSGRLTAGGVALAIGEGPTDGPATFAIRPEHVRIATDSGPNTIPVTVLDCISRGEYWEILTESPFGPIVARHDTPLARAESARIALPSANLFPIADDEPNRVPSRPE